MTPADERILKLIAKWRGSLELHAGYAKLSDDQYWLVQPWPKHQRPTAWVIQLAQQRLADLERIVKGRVAAGDPSISEALELMSFMANLVGAQHVERFVPVAEPEQERPIASLQATPPAGGAARKSAPAKPAAAESTDEMPALPVAARPKATRDKRAPRTSPKADPTSEMPALAAPRADATHEMPALAAAPRADATREMPALPAVAKADATAEMPAPLELVAEDPPLPPDESDLEVVRDAVRLLGWGRQWHELADAIARMAGRPDKTRVRSILQAHRVAIEHEATAGVRTH